jgi:uncharacterized membrane protein YeaQ/YmgE (transglycosylase-associated protein family)
MTVSEYSLKENFRAPAINLAPGAKISYRSYKKGSILKGYVMENDDPNVALTDVPIIITTDNTAIPLGLISKIRDVEIDGKAVDIPAPLQIETSGTPQSDEQKKIIPTRYQDELNKIKQKYVIANVVKKSRNSVNGMIFGAISGLILSAIFKKPAFISMLLGTVVGGVVGHKLTKNITADQIKNKTAKI